MRSYLQLIIIMLEIKQLGESITRVTHKRKALGIRTCPQRLVKKVKNMKQPNTRKEVQFEYLLQFDQSVKVPDTWVDAYTLKLFRFSRDELTLLPNSGGMLGNKR